MTRIDAESAARKRQTSATPALIVSLLLMAHAALASETVALPNQEIVLQEPQECLKSDEMCSLQTSSHEKFKLKIGESRLVMDASTLLLRESSERISLLQGTLWIKTEGPFSVHTEYGVVESDGGEFWVTRTRGETLTASAISGTLSLKPRGANIEISLAAGEENWLGRVGRDGVAESGTPCPLLMIEHIARWARLYPGQKQEFEKEVRSFRLVWQAASERSAELHQDLAKRRIETLNEQQRRREEERRKEAEHRQVLRRIYRERTLLD